MSSLLPDNIKTDRLVSTQTKLTQYRIFPEQAGNWNFICDALCYHGLDPQSSANYREIPRQVRDGNTAKVLSKFHPLIVFIVCLYYKNLFCHIFSEKFYQTVVSFYKPPFFSYNTFYMVLYFTRYGFVHPDLSKINDLW
jgi:hypothetical protein